MRFAEIARPGHQAKVEGMLSQFGPSANLTRIQPGDLFQLVHGAGDRSALIPILGQCIAGLQRPLIVLQDLLVDLGGIVAFPHRLQGLPQGHQQGHPADCARIKLVQKPQAFFGTPLGGGQGPLKQRPQATHPRIVPYEFHQWLQLRLVEHPRRQLLESRRHPPFWRRGGLEPARPQQPQNEQSARQTSQPPGPVGARDRSRRRVGRGRIGGNLGKRHGVVREFEPTSGELRTASHCKASSGTCGGGTIESLETRRLARGTRGD